MRLWHPRWRQQVLLPPSSSPGDAAGAADPPYQAPRRRQRGSCATWRRRARRRQGRETRRRSSPTRCCWRGAARRRPRSWLPTSREAPCILSLDRTTCCESKPGMLGCHLGDLEIWKRLGQLFLMQTGAGDVDGSSIIFCGLCNRCMMVARQQCVVKRMSRLSQPQLPMWCGGGGAVSCWKSGALTPAGKESKGK